MFEFLRSLMPGRSTKDAPSTAKPGTPEARKHAKGASAKANPGTKPAAERQTFGQKKKAVYKPAHRAKQKPKH